MNLPKYIPIRVDTKWGFCNEKKEITIDPIYDDVKMFSEGLAFVRKVDNWGVINEEGQEVVEFCYSDAEIRLNDVAGFDERTGNLEFHGGKAVVCKIKYTKGYDYETEEEYDYGVVHWGVIDNQGNIIIEFIYDELKSLSDGILIARKDDIHSNRMNRYGIIDLDNNIIVNFSYGYIQRISKHFICAYMDDPSGSGQTLLNFKGEYIADSINCPLGNLSERMYKIRQYGQKIGYINQEGKIIIKPIYKDGLDFHEEKTAVRLFSEGFGAKIEWVYLNKIGNIIIRDGFLSADSFYEGFALVEKQTKNKIQRFFIDEYGNNIFNKYFNEDYYVNCFRNGYAALMDKRNRKIFYIDKKGNELTEEKVHDVLKDDYIEPKFLDDTEIKKIEILFLEDEFEKRYSYKENFAVVTKNKKYYFIDEFDNIIFPNKKTLDENGLSFPYFQKACSFNNGFAKVRINDFWGFINTSGRLVVIPKYESIVESFVHGLAKVRKNSLNLYISSSGTEFIKKTVPPEEELPF